MTTATPEEARTQIVNLVREFVRRDVAPVAQELDRDDRVPHDLIDQMKEMGLFGITVPEEYGGLGLDYTTFATIFEELSKGFMSLSGAIGDPPHPHHTCWSTTARMSRRSGFSLTWLPAARGEGSP